MDLQRNRYDTFEELRQYCLRVASAVGLICVEIFGYRDLQTRDYAIDLGIALQLTNIIRDVAPDLERGRVYIPTEDLRRFGCTEDDLRGGRLTENVRRLLAFQVERARRFYRKADAALPRHDERRLVAARIMGAIYFELLRAIERAGYDVFRGRVRVGAAAAGDDRRVHVAESHGAVQMTSPDVIVIGAGVAGLRAAVAAGRSRRACHRARIEGGARRARDGIQRSADRRAGRQRPARACSAAITRPSRFCGR